MQKLDILAIAAHPDDIELSCGGTIALQVSLGNKVGILDLTEGEMGTRGSREIRRAEAKAAKEALGIEARDNMKFKDALFLNDHEHQFALIKKIRTYRPEIVITNAPDDRHSDHPRASQLVTDACFMSGLAKIETEVDGEKQEAWRPKSIYYFIQSKMLMPDFIVDVTDHWETKMDSVRAYKSQFYDPSSNEPETYISSPGFMKMIEARGAELGHAIGVKYGEGFIKQRIPGIKDINHLI